MTQYPSDEELAIHKASEDSVSSIVHPPPPPERHWLTDFIPAHPVPAFIVMAAVVFGVIFASIQATHLPSSAVVVCTGDQNHDTKALQSAITNARNAGTVNVAAGTCALNANLPVKQAETVNGAGPGLTFLVQHADANILQITSPGVTIESLSLDTGTFHPGIPPVKKSPVSAVLFSNSSNTTIRDVVAVTGTGFGMRIVGPSPCDSYRTHGTVIQNVQVTNAGSGGFSSIDISCTNGATLSGLTIAGNYIDGYKVTNMSVTDMTYTPNNKPCQFSLYFTSPSSNLTITNVSGGGGVKLSGNPITGVTQTNVVKAAGC